MMRSDKTTKKYVVVIGERRKIQKEYIVLRGKEIGLQKEHLFGGERVEKKKKTTEKKSMSW